MTMVSSFRVGTQQPVNDSQNNANIESRPVPAPRHSLGSSASSGQTHRELARKMPGSAAKLKVAGQLARASTTWPGQPTSRACIIL